TLGSAPVKNEALITDGHNILNIGISAVLDKPYAPEKFGDVENFLAAKNIEGTTEDLAFSPDGKLVLAVPDGLIFMDESGNASLQELAGDKLVSPLGIAYDSTGNLWVADSAGKALRKISPDFKVSTVLTGDGTQDFKQPNFTAIGYGGKVYLTDPCIKEILRIDPLTAKIEAIMTFDAATEGGPNGIVFDPEKKRAFVTTENIGLLCADGSVPIEDPVAGLYEIEITDQGFGAKKAVAANMGIFGDGATMDNEGNVYAIFDAKKKDEFALEESAVWIFPAEGGAPVKFISANDKILANLEFGSGAFGGKTLYISLLAVPVFGFNERGVVKFDVGIQGAKTLADFD
ncbi:MAG: hypothetical protein FJ088_07655, partial [Deltaproteobacteria bacterium]|nr:hypothetical protein [Deltaproteobacteria bacterium]